MKKNLSKKNGVTIDDLAIMIAKGFDSIEKRLEVVEKRLEVVEKRLEVVEKRLEVVEKRLGSVEERLGSVEENLKSTRRDLLNLGDRFVPRYEFDDFKIRFNRLEKKIKEK